jgi:hypothetical protein
VFVIEARLKAAAVTCLIGAVFTWFGLMHSASIGFGKSPAIAFSYVLMGGVMLLAMFMADRHGADVETMIDEPELAETGEQNTRPSNLSAATAQT